MVVYFQHENKCPNVQISCSACFELILRKNVAVSIFYEYFIHYLFSSFQMFSLSAQSTGILIFKFRLYTQVEYCKLQLNLLLRILKLINHAIEPPRKSTGKMRLIVLVYLFLSRSYI